jgi:nucleoid DNA-binding protein
MIYENFIRQVAHRHGLNIKDVRHFAAVIFEQLGETVFAGDRVTVPGFGVFMLKYRKRRSVIDPMNTARKMKIRAREQVGFKASKHQTRTLQNQAQCTVVAPARARIEDHAP